MYIFENVKHLSKLEYEDHLANARRDNYYY